MRIRSIRVPQTNHFYACFLAIATFVLMLALAGCGSGSSTVAPPPNPAGTTSLTVQLSSSANGKFSTFNIPLQGISLVSSSGKTVSLLDTPQIAEFSHLNGGAAPLVSVTIPQGTYSSANVTYSNANFTYLTSDSTGTRINTDAQSVGVQKATVNFASPITISGTAMTLTLDLQESQSVTCNCTGNPPETFSINPVFTLTATAVAAQPTTNRNGNLPGIRARVGSVNLTGNSVGVTATNGISFPTIATGPNLQVTTDGATIYQGIGGLAALAPKMLVDMDASIQSDGSLRATRIEVQDPTALNVMMSQVMFVSPLVPELTAFGTQEQGDDLSINPIGFYNFGFGTAVFQTSGQLAVPAGLPFTASFSGSNMVAGQKIALSFGPLSYFGGSLTAATVITLMPQTINGTVISTSTNGSFTVYQVALPAYDFIPTVNGAKTVTVYTNGTTQLLTSAPVSLGNVVRFSGLLFNDAGTLRMVAAQAADGVTP
jgi:uncharacterized protein DUF5666